MSNYIECDINNKPVTLIRNIDDISAYKKQKDSNILYEVQDDKFDILSSTYSLSSDEDYRYDSSTQELYIYDPHNDESLPEIKILNITSDDPNVIIDNENNEITIKETYTVSGNVEIQINGTKYTEFSGSFRLPIQAEDGDTIFVLVNITDGAGTISIKLNNSGIWSIAEKNINVHLANIYLRFKDLKIFVVL